MMRCTLLLWIILISAARTQAQTTQCTMALPNVIPAIGGDTPKQVDGIWYRYRVLGKSLSTNPRTQFTTVGQVVDPITGLPVFLQWRVTALLLSSSSGSTSGYGPVTTMPAQCQFQFWTGMYTGTGEEIGDEGISDDNYIMRPTHYTVLYHDYQKLMVHYSCFRSGANGLCTSPRIIVETRTSPDKTTATDLAAFDAIINSIFAKYCVTVDNIPKNTFSADVPCPFIEPPPCIASDIQGLNNSVSTGIPGTGPSPPVTPSSGSYSVPPPTCKWPVSIPAPGNIDAGLVAGNYYVWRRSYAPEGSPGNQVVLFTNVGAAELPLGGGTGRMYTIQYANYANLASTVCINGFLVFVQGSNGIVRGLIIPYTAGGAPQIIGLTTLVADGKTILYYGCEAVDAATGLCAKPTVVHMIKSNPLQMSQAEKDAADAVGNSFFSKFGCSAADVPLISHTNDKPTCPFVSPPECMQKHIDGYLQTATQ